MSPRRLVLAWLLLPVAVGAQAEPADPDRAPPDLGDGWAVAAPSAQGFDPLALDGLARRIGDGDYGQIDALLVFRHGHLVLERYYGGFGPYTLHTLQSATKSIAATLVGLAIHAGAIGGVEQPIHELLPAYRHVFEADPDKRQITLHHVLTMTAGMDWPEQGQTYGAENIVWALADAYDWPGFVLARPMSAAPGQVFNYSTGLSTLLGVMIQNATGMGVDRFAERHLFDPLGIPNYGWWRNTRHPDRWVHTGGGLHLAPRDLAKIGHLYLDDGRWGDRQVLPPDWPRAATEPRIATGRDPHEHYGYQWWLRPIRQDGGAEARANDIIHAAGIGGQHLFVVPALDLLVVFTGHNFQSRAAGRKPVDLLYQDIIPALTTP